MDYELTINSDCSLSICDIYDNSGYLEIPTFLTDAILINSVSINYSEACDEETEVFDEVLLPHPTGVQFDIDCQDVDGIPRFTLIVTGNTGPAVPAKTVYNWYIRTAAGALLAFFPNSAQPQWTITTYSPTDVITLDLVLSNGVIISISRSIDSISATINCFDHVLTAHTTSINTAATSYSISNGCLQFVKPTDGIYSYTIVVNYNTALANNLEYSSDKCSYISCDTECEIVRGLAESLDSDIYLLHQSVKSAIYCQRCQDACTIFEYVYKQLNNDTDCGCHELPTNCC